jgi:hypothetical protein
LSCGEIACQKRGSEKTDSMIVKKEIERKKRTPHECRRNRPCPRTGASTSRKSNHTAFATEIYYFFNRLKRVLFSIHKKVCARCP